MSDENIREADRKFFVNEIRNTLSSLGKAKDVNDQWEFIKAEEFEEAYNAVAVMLVGVNVGEEEIL